MKPYLIGIAGGTGSGKTTIAKKLVHALGPEHATMITFDNYYKDQSHISPLERKKINFDHPDSLETELLIKHLALLIKGQAVDIPTYDFTQNIRAQATLHLEPMPVIIIEGILLFVDETLRNQFDLKLFIDTPDDIRFIRRLERDIKERGRTYQSVVNQYLTTVRPMHEQFVEPTKRAADLIIPEGGNTYHAVDIIIANLQSKLKAKVIPSPTFNKKT